MIPISVSSWLETQGGGRIIRMEPVPGGCVNNGLRLEVESGQTYFLKTNPDAPANMFIREVEGLKLLCRPDGPVLPQPLLWGKTFLLMEDLVPAAIQPNYWVNFGHQLAALHTYTQPQFGLEEDNYIGSNLQRNGWCSDGYQFFGQQRLLFQAELAWQHEIFSSYQVRQVERFAARLEQWIPVQPASLLHGDLWSGNVLTDRAGRPALIDPAAYWGWAEADLAMTALFGGFPEVFYRAYQEKRPLEPGWRGRFPIYNLYHLLNHLNLFGQGYAGQVQATLTRFLD